MVEKIVYKVLEIESLDSYLGSWKCLKAFVSYIITFSVVLCDIVSKDTKCTNLILQLGFSSIVVLVLAKTTGQQ